jgi:urease accessory protein
VATETELSSAALLRLLQLADSGFPTGAFAFSHGLEGLVEAGFVKSEADVAALLRAQVEENLAGIEAPAMRHAHRFAAAGDVAQLLALDDELTALKPVPAFRDGSAKVGRRFLESTVGLVDGATVDEYRRAVAGGQAAGHHAVAFGVVMQAAGLDEEAAALALGAGFVNGLAAAAVRLGVIGQGAAQRMVARLHPEVLAAVERARQTPLDELGAYLPMVDVAGLRQPTLPGRLFAS